MRTTVPDNNLLGLNGQNISPDTTFTDPLQTNFNKQSLEEIILPTNVIPTTKDGLPAEIDATQESASIQLQEGRRLLTRSQEPSSPTQDAIASWNGFFHHSATSKTPRPLEVADDSLTGASQGETTYPLRSVELSNSQSLRESKASGRPLNAAEYSPIACCSKGVPALFPIPPVLAKIHLPDWLAPYIHKLIPYLPYIKGTGIVAVTWAATSLLLPRIVKDLGRHEAWDADTQSVALTVSKIIAWSWVLSVAIPSVTGLHPLIGSLSAGFASSLYINKILSNILQGIAISRRDALRFNDTVMREGKWYGIWKMKASKIITVEMIDQNGVLHPRTGTDQPWDYIEFLSVPITIFRPYEKIAKNRSVKSMQRLKALWWKSTIIGRALLPHALFLLGSLLTLGAGIYYFHLLQATVPYLFAAVIGLATWLVARHIEPVIEALGAALHWHSNHIWLLYAFGLIGVYTFGASMALHALGMSLSQVLQASTGGPAGFVLGVAWNNITTFNDFLDIRLFRRYYHLGDAVEISQILSGTIEDITAFRLVLSPEGYPNAHTLVPYTYMNTAPPTRTKSPENPDIASRSLPIATRSQSPAKPIIPAAHPGEPIPPLKP